jgi:hypothetical protein
VRALVLALVLCACGGGKARPVAMTYPVTLTLPAADGGDIDLSAYRGKIVVLHVFTTWSIEATGDAPLLEAANHDDVIVIGIALDLEGYAVVAPWRKALGVHYLIALADDAFRTGGGPLGSVNAVPFTVILDRSGRVSRRIDRPLREGDLEGL